MENEEKQPANKVGEMHKRRGKMADGTILFITLSEMKKPSRRKR